MAIRRGWRSGALAAGLTLTLAATALAAEAEDQDQDQPKYPTAEFAEGAKSTSVTVGDITAGVSMVRRPDIDANSDVPVLQVLVGSVRALETPGVVSGMEQPAAEASIAEIDSGNQHREVYFASYSGGAHCCTHVVIAEEVGKKWVAVTVGDFEL
jgi:hypothetical protein